MSDRAVELMDEYVLKIPVNHRLFPIAQMIIIDKFVNFHWHLVSKYENELILPVTVETSTRIIQLSA